MRGLSILRDIVALLLALMVMVFGFVAGAATHEITHILLNPTNKLFAICIVGWHSIYGWSWTEFSGPIQIQSEILPGILSLIAYIGVAAVGLWLLVRKINKQP